MSRQGGGYQQDTDTEKAGTVVMEVVVAEAEVVIEAREEVGKEGGAKLITKGVKLNSTSGMEFISTVILGLDREDIILAEATEPYIWLELK